MRIPERSAEPEWPTGLLEAISTLMAVPSESYAEGALADLIQRQLWKLAAVRGDGFTVDRIGDNVVARTRLGRSHRLILDRSLDEAEAWLRGWLAPSLTDGDSTAVTDRARAAPPRLDHPLLAGPIRRHRLTTRAKLGWTDAAFFAGRGIPAANFGPGDPVVAHTAEERLERASIDRVRAVLGDLLSVGVSDAA